LKGGNGERGQLLQTPPGDVLLRKIWKGRRERHMCSFLRGGTRGKKKTIKEEWGGERGQGFPSGRRPKGHSWWRKGKKEGGREGASNKGPQVKKHIGKGGGGDEKYRGELAGKRKMMYQIS